MLRTVAEATGLWESIIFNRGRNVASWAFMGRVFHHVFNGCSLSVA